jgi:hypothetical protein
MLIVVAPQYVCMYLYKNRQKERERERERERDMRQILGEQCDFVH